MSTTSLSMGFDSLYEKFRHQLSEIKIMGLSLDLVFLGIMIGICNIHILTGRSCENLIFDFQAVVSGGLYRLVTHPFVHLSWYHFLLDAGAFTLLYTGLSETRKLRKLAIVSICGICGLGLPLLLAPAIYSRGLCGLSGIAHGLMAFSALEMIRDPEHAGIGWVCLGSVILKSVYEAITGTVLLSFLQFGLCGVPIAMCHAGGVIGGIVSYFLFHYAGMRPDKPGEGKILLPFNVHEGIAAEGRRRRSRQRCRLNVNWN